MRIILSFTGMNLNVPAVMINLKHILVIIILNYNIDTGSNIVYIILMFKLYRYYWSTEWQTQTLCVCCSISDYGLLLIAEAECALPVSS